MSKRQSPQCTDPSNCPPAAVGDDLPDAPLILTKDLHVKVPLEPTYRATSDALPDEMRVAIETGVMPEPDAE